MAKKPNTKHKPTEIEYYEALIGRTAQMYEWAIDEDEDDIRSILRIKVWKALEAYDPSRSSIPIETYVFTCIRNQVRDLQRKRRRNWVYLEDRATKATDDLSGGLTDYFEEKYLSVDHDEVYGHVEGEIPLIPNTLSSAELETVKLLYEGYKTSEIAELRGVEPKDVRSTLASIREKMADWRPS